MVDEKSYTYFVKLTQLIFILLISIPGVSSANGGEPPIKWPSLLNIKFVKDRPATQEDVKANRAVFVAAIKGKSIGKPIKIIIPQYAYHIKDKKKNPVIVIQAEEASGKMLIGAINLSGTGVVGFLEEFELLGTMPK